MAEILLPSPATPDIFSYGFDMVLNKTGKVDEKNPLVYDVLKDIIRSELLPSGSLAGLLNTGKESDTPSNKISLKAMSDFSATGRIGQSVGGTGAVTFNTNGMNINTGATATSYARGNWYHGAGRSMKANPTFACALNIATLNAASGSANAYFGLGLVGDSGSALNYSGDPHCGFKIIKSGGVVSLYATQAGTSSGETASNQLTTLADADDLDLILKVNNNNISYYWRKNQGELSSPTVLVGNKPDPNSVRNETMFIVSNVDTAFAFSINVAQASLER